MRASVPSAVLPAAFNLPRSELSRELLRAAAAAGVYLLLRPIWEWTGLRELYRAIVVGTAERIVLATDHFPLTSSLSNLTTKNIDFVILLAAALAIVSTRLEWHRRLRLFGGAVAVIVAIQIVAFALWVKLTAVEELQAQHRILVLLPWEFRVVDRVKYLLYDFGQPAMMFALFAATLVWNTAPATSPRGRPAAVSVPARALRSRWMLGLALAVAATLLVGWIGWRHSRELDPTHVQAHAKIGHLFWMKGDRTKAEAQYALAVAGDTADPGVFYNLARLAASRGRLDESRRLFQKCTQVSSDPAWTARIEHALAELASLKAPPRS